MVSTATSQQNFKPGYIITNSNDSLKGFIDFREWGYTPSKITFRRPTGEKQDFTPGQIREFAIPPREYYVSRKVSLDLTSFDINDLTSFGKPRSVKDTLLFLSVIVKGKTSLFFIKDRNDREHFYIEKENQPTEELILKKNMKTSDEGFTNSSKIYLVTTEIFKGQLILFFSDCLALKEEINGSEYKTASLRSLVVHYNECHPGGIVQFVKKPEKIRVKFGLLAGMRLSQLKFSGSYPDLPSINFPSCYSFTGGVSLYLIMPRERAQYILLNELVYESYSTQGGITQFGFPSVTINNAYSFNIASIKLNTLFRYQYPNWKIHPFANIGMSNGYSIKTTNTKTSDIHYLFDSTSTTSPALDSFRKYEVGILVGAGASFLGLGAEFRVEWTNGMSTVYALNSTVRSYYLLVSYTF